MAPRRAKINKFDYKKLSANDVICPICRSILIKPVTLPCSHGFCSSCFETTTENANCPLCSKRVGSWLRTARKSKKLINEPLWQAIQQLFPIQIKNKLNESVKEDKKKPEIVPSTSTALAKPTMIVTNSKTLNNFATKEYTCRILCQDITSKDVTNTNESLQKKSKRIQKTAGTESLSDRSNSIESECLYFKPIDYRHNPPSEGLAPIKVPTRKPNVNPHSVKILAPCGQNQINMNGLESAFARLLSPEKKSDIVEAETSHDVPTKRKYEKSDSKSKKKLKINKPEIESKSVCDSENISLSILDEQKRFQEKADFELATKLQQTYNQLAKYSTRSEVLKQTASKRQVKIEGIMTPYKVK